MLRQDADYTAAQEKRRYATTFRARVDATRALNAAKAMIDTAELDTKYNEAVRRGNKKETQALVLEAAERAMPASVVRDEGGKLLPVYHWTNASFNAFDRSYARTRNEMVCFFFAPDAESTREYGNNAVRAYLNITNPTYDPYLDRTHEDSGTLLRERLAYEGYDGVVRTENGKIVEYMAFDPEQIKSAEPVVYDDNGKVIPLSERFNSKSRISIHFCAGGNPAVEHQKVQSLVTVLLVDSGDEHTLGVYAHHLARGEIDYRNAGLADKLLRLVILMDTAQNHAILALTVVHHKLQKLLGLGHCLAGEYLNGAEVGLGKGLKVNHFLENRLDLDLGEVYLFLDGGSCGSGRGGLIVCLLIGVERLHCRDFMI